MINPHIYKYTSKMLQINFVPLFLAFPIVPSSGQWTCNAGRVLTNRTLRAGVHSGEFKEAGPTKDLIHCIKRCCEQQKCDVAFRVSGICFLVSCRNNYLCQPVAASNPGLTPEISYVVHNFPAPDEKKDLSTLVGFLNLQQQKENVRKPFQNSNDKRHQQNPSIGPSSLQRQQRQQQQFKSPISSSKDQIAKTRLNVSNTQSKFRLAPMANVENGSKRVNIQTTRKKLNSTQFYFDSQRHQLKSTANNLINTQFTRVTPKSGSCYPTSIHESVSLKYGPDSGDFYDYGNIGDMEKCIDLCCKDKDCDVAFMVGRTCYTTSCYSIEKCQMIPASKTAKLRSQLAYIIKKSDVKREGKLAATKNNEMKLRKEREKEQKLYESFIHNLKNDNDETQSEEDLNIPSSLTRSCQHGSVLKDHILIGGSKAGVYKYRGKTPGFQACFRLCCTDTFCDAALLLGRKCYSVQCYRNTKCSSRRIRARSLHSTLAFVLRKNGGDVNESKLKFLEYSSENINFLCSKMFKYVLQQRYD